LQRSNTVGQKKYINLGVANCIVLFSCLVFYKILPGLGIVGETASIAVVGIDTVVLVVVDVLAVHVAYILAVHVVVLVVDQMRICLLTE